MDLWCSRVLHVTLAEDCGTTARDEARFVAHRLDPDLNLTDNTTWTKQFNYHLVFGGHDDYQLPSPY